MPSPTKAPQVAHFEEYDEEAEAVKAGSRHEARCPPKAINRYKKSTGLDSAATNPPAIPTKDTASDSGYSSHTSNTRGSDASSNHPRMPPPPVPVAAAPAPSLPPQPIRKNSTSAKSRPVVHRVDTKRSPSKPPPPSPNAVRHPSENEDPYYRYPGGMPVQHPGYPMPAESNGAAYSAAYPAALARYSMPPQMPPYGYTQMSAAAAATGPSSPHAAHPSRPRAGSMSRTRPVSVHGSSIPTALSTYHGLPLSQSAYHHVQYAAWAGQPAAGMEYSSSPHAYSSSPHTYFNALSLADPTAVYNHPATVAPTPPSPTTARNGLQRTISARTANPPLQTYDRPPSRSQAPVHQAPPLNRNPSARQSSQMPPQMGGYRYGSRDQAEEEYSESESGSEMTSSTNSDSESETSSEAEYEPMRRPRRKSQLAHTASGNLSLRSRFANEPIEPSPARPRLSREILHRSRPSAGNVVDEYISSDNVDSESTARAVVDRRQSTSYHPNSSNRSSRRPSLSTNASSGATRETNGSNLSGSRVIIEDRYGRRAAYLSQEQQAALVKTLRQQERRHERQPAQQQHHHQQTRERHHQHQRHLQDEQIDRLESAAAYQDAISGPRALDITAENIKARTSRQSSSRGGGGSRHSAGSRPTGSTGPRNGVMPSPAKALPSALTSSGAAEGIKIQSGETVLHIYGDTNVEVRPGTEEGEPPRLVFASTSSAAAAALAAAASAAGGSQTSAAAAAAAMMMPPPPLPHSSASANQPRSTDSSYYSSHRSSGGSSGSGTANRRSGRREEGGRDREREARPSRGRTGGRGDGRRRDTLVEDF